MGEDKEALQPCRVTAKQWSTVAAWSWAVQNDNCAICKAPLVGLCITCQAQGMSHAPAPLPTAVVAPARQRGSHATATLRPFPDSSTAAQSSLVPPQASAPGGGTSSIGTTPPPTKPSSQCWVVWGKCGHVYHHHCMTRWLSERSTCPVCGKEWLGLKYTSNE